MAIVPKGTPNNLLKPGDLIDYDTYYYNTGNGTYQTKDGKFTGTLGGVNQYLAGAALNTSTTKQAAASALASAQAAGLAAVPAQYSQITRYFPGAVLFAQTISGGGGIAGRVQWRVKLPTGDSLDADVVLGTISAALAMNLDPRAQVNGMLSTTGTTGGAVMDLPQTQIAGTSQLPVVGASQPIQTKAGATIPAGNVSQTVTTGAAAGNAAEGVAQAGGTVKDQVQAASPASSQTAQQWAYYWHAVTGNNPPDAGTGAQQLTFDEWYARVVNMRTADNTQTALPDSSIEILGVTLSKTMVYVLAAAGALVIYKVLD